MEDAVANLDALCEMHVALCEMLQTLVSIEKEKKNSQSAGWQKNTFLGKQKVYILRVGYAFAEVEEEYEDIEMPFSINQKILIWGGVPYLGL